MAAVLGHGGRGGRGQPSGRQGAQIDDREGRLDMTPDDLQRLAVARQVEAGAQGRMARGHRGDGGAEGRQVEDSLDLGAAEDLVGRGAELVLAVEEDAGLEGRERIGVLGARRQAQAVGGGEEGEGSGGRRGRGPIRRSALRRRRDDCRRHRVYRVPLRG